MTSVRALIAEDEPLLAQALTRQLGIAWPELQILDIAGNGADAVEWALRDTPEVLFLDIRMPAKTGLEVAAEVLDAWPEDKATPLLVFVTAYDEFAIEAFEHAAVDFVLKPVVPERIGRTVARIRQRLAERTEPLVGDIARLMHVVQTMSLEPPVQAEPLTMLNVGLGDTVHLVAVDDVLYFEATDKYVRVVSPAHDGLIRVSMRELLCRMPGQNFMQVHRSVVVNRRAIISASRDDLGHVHLKLRGVEGQIAVSRAFAHHFRPM